MLQTHLAPFNRRSEDVSIVPIVISELELGNIERHVSPAHFMERADNTALEDRPEAFDGLSVNCANDILPSRMVNGRVWIILVERIVAGILIGAKQADFVRDGFADERSESGGIHVRDHAGNDVSLAADGADDRRFARTDAASSAAPAAFIPMPVFGQTTNESFIDFDDAAELINVLHESGPDFMAHEPCGPIRAKAHVAIDLQCAHALLARKHKVDNAEPLSQGLVRVLENRSCDMGEAVISSGRRAFVAQPIPMHCAVFLDLHIATPRAGYAFRPAPTSEIGATSIFVRESLFPLRDGHLVNWLGLFRAGHIGYSSLDRSQYDTFN
jgi:hypothetical protein